MATPEEKTQLKDSEAPATEETKLPAPEVESQSVAAPEETSKQLPSQDTDTAMEPKEETVEKVVPQEETDEKVVPQEENTPEEVSQEDKSKTESPGQSKQTLSEEEKIEEVDPQEGNDKMETQEESKQEDDNQKLACEEGGEKTSVSHEENKQPLEAPKEKDKGLVSQPETDPVLPSSEENTQVVESQEEDSQKLLSQQENNVTLEDSNEMVVSEEQENEHQDTVPQEDINQMAVTQHEDSQMTEPQEDSSKENKQVVVSEEQENKQQDMVPQEDSQMTEPQEDSTQVIVPQEDTSQVTVLAQEASSQVTAPQEENKQAVEPEEENNQIAVPPETSQMEVAQENIQMVVPKEEKGQRMVPEENDQMVMPEEESIQMPVPLENSQLEAPVEINNQLVVPQEDNSQMMVSHEDDSQMVLPLEGNTQMLPSDEHNTQMPVSHEENHQIIVSHEEHHQIMVSHEQNHEMLVSQEENDHQIMGSHEEDHQMMSNHHMGDHLMVMDEDNNQLMTPHDENNQLIMTHDENSQLILTHDENELVTPDSRPNKRRRKKSVVWEHFTIESVGDGCRRACCKQCKQSFAYSTGSKVAGTSHLKRHIAKGTCLALLRNQGHQMLSYTPGSGGGGTSGTPKRRYRSPNASYFPFDSDRCRHEIAKMIIMHDYPLHMVEHAGFVTFIQNLQPRFGMVSFNSVQGDCVAMYLREKENVVKFIEGLPGRVSLTLDMWTSSESIGYVFITGHFIDGDWKPQKRLLNVEMEPYPDSDAALSHAVACSLSDWNLEGKLFSVAFNHPVGEPGLESLRSLLCIKNTSILNGQLVLGNCISQTLTSMAKDVMLACRDLITKIRDSVKYVKTLESNEEKFLDLKRQLQVPTEKNLQLDDQTQWNTTYGMLLAASELKEVFSCLDTSDPHYKEAPSMTEWKQVETICSILKHLVDAAKIIGVSTSPISITFFHEAWRIQAELSRVAATGDPFVSSFIGGLQEKIEKYVKDCCLVLAIAVVMDPRFKMKLVEFSFSKIYGEDAPAYIKIVDDGVHELFQEYVSLPLPLTPTYEENNGGNPNGGENQRGGMDNGMADFDMYIMESTSHQTKSELDMYLDDSLLPRVPEFDVLSWWRQNKMKYPTLSKMARDILSIPVSTASVENMFDTVLPRQLDQYRSSLRAETVEALVCAKDWLRQGMADAAAVGNLGDGVVKMEL